MTRVSMFSPIVLRKAFPALVVILIIFISLIFLIRYTDAFFLVILAWIIVPVLLVRLWRWLNAKLVKP